MSVPDHCGDEEDLREIVNTPLATGDSSVQAQENVNGLPLIMAKIEDKWWPIAQCGQTGMGIGEFPPSGTRIKGGVGCSIFEIYDEVTADACLLECDYRIDLLAETSYVILGKIDGRWSILRVLDSAAITVGERTCQCCNVGRARLKVKITDAGVGCTNLIGKEFFLFHSDAQRGQWNGSVEFVCSTEEQKTLTIQLTCLATENSVTQQLSDWDVQALCDDIEFVAEVDEVLCDTAIDPYDDECAQSLTQTEGDPVTGFKLTFSADPLVACCDCSFTAQVTLCSKKCHLEEEELEIVTAEACGLPNLAEGVHVILAKIPNQTGAIEYHVVRACSSVLCEDPCNPDNPEGDCCGQPCSELAAQLSVSIEFVEHLSGDPCGECPGTEGDNVVTMTKDCGDTDIAEYTQDINPVEVCAAEGEFPESPLVALLTDLFLTCAARFNVCGTVENPLAEAPFTLDISTINGLETLSPNLDTACCNPLYLEFENVDLSCSDNFMLSGISRYRIIITE